MGNGNNPWVWSGFGSLIFSADEVRVKGHGLMRATVEHHLMIVDHQRAVDRIFHACDQLRVMRGEHYLFVVTEQSFRHMRGRHLVQTLVGSSATITAGEKLNAEAIASR